MKMFTSGTILFCCSLYYTFALVYEGAARLTKDISLMIGHDIPQIWKYMWLYVTPPLMIVS